MNAVVVHALESGVLLSAVRFALLLAVLRANPEIMLNDYPPDVRAKWGPITERTRRQRPVVALVLFVAIVVFVVWSVRPPRALAIGIPVVLAGSAMCTAVVSALM